jgi:hypothetical protein
LGLFCSGITQIVFDLKIERKKERKKKKKKKEREKRKVRRPDVAEGEICGVFDGGVGVVAAFEVETARC